MESNRVQRVKSTARLIPLGFFFVTLFFVLGFPRLTQVPRANPDPKSTVKPDIEEIKKAVVREDYGKLPLSFIQNEGQVDKQVKFYEKGKGRTTFFTENGIFLSLTDRQSASTTDNAQSAVIKLMLLGANKHPKIIAEGMQEGKVNYFIGNDPKKWKTNIPTYQAVIYNELYSGINIKFYGNNRQMEYDIIVKPGADPSKIKLAYEGIEGLRVTEDGNLEIRMKEGTILQNKPIVYQEINGRRVDVVGTFKIFPRTNHQLKRSTYGFEVAHYNKSHPLLIDPILVYSTYLGGVGSDSGIGIAVDASGNAYVTGQTHSANFPTTPGAFQTALGGSQNAFVIKLNAAGSALLYSTYLGGVGSDSGNGIAVDASGNAYVTGQTHSANFPTTPGAFQMVLGGSQNAFVTKLNAAGSALLYSTYLGGVGSDSGNGIAVDASGNAYATGRTNSANFPTTPGAFQMAFNESCYLNYDAFVTKLNASGSALVYSTYLGGGRAGLNGCADGGNGIAVDASGSAYVTGYAISVDFPTTPGAFQRNIRYGELYGDAFVTKLNASGSALVYSTFLGGDHCLAPPYGGDDFGYGIAVDASGNAYVTGQTNSADFPTTPGAFQAEAVVLCPAVYGTDGAAFITKLNAAGSALLYSTYLGGTSVESGHGIAVDASDNAYVTGSTRSSNFPTVSALQEANGGSRDAFVTKLNATGSALVYSTYLGGNGIADSGSGIALDGLGNAYITGYTDSTNFPTASPIQAINAGGGDAFVAKIGEPPSTTTTTTTTTTSTTTTTNCNDQNKGQDKDKGKGHDKGRCKGHDKDK